MYGSEPPTPLQAPRFRLLVSPVVPSLAPQTRAAVEPFVTAILTVTDAPVLKAASEPPPSPMTLNSDASQAVARSVTVSLPLVVYASVPLVNTSESLPPFTAVPDIFRLVRSVMAILGTDTAALFL